MKADIVIARFDGLELDSGTVVEFITAKTLGKPTVIFRCDYRHLLNGIVLPTGKDLDVPYNLMVKNWPRTVEVHFESLLNYIDLFAKEGNVHNRGMTFQDIMNTELTTVQKSFDEIAYRLIDALELLTKTESPYPLEYQEFVYKALLYSVGSGFDQLITENEIKEIVEKLRNHDTL
jgi:hypothetical protein